MPFGLKPQCSLCKCITSPIWRKTERGEVLCNDCTVKPTISAGNSVPVEETKEPDAPSVELVASTSETTVASHSQSQRKSTRKVTKNKQQSQNKSTSAKGKSRRITFKKSATKAPVAIATPITTESLYHKGTYYQIGDIVSLVDVEGDIYYAQIRGLLQDQYCEKSGVITWLLPTMLSPTGRFDASTYIIGPEEEIPRKLDCMEFVCHAPSDYYKTKNSPYPTYASKPHSSFIWTRLGPQVKMLKTDEVFDF